jgi:hypothetical protein
MNTCNQSLQFRMKTLQICSCSNSFRILCLRLPWDATTCRCMHRCSCWCWCVWVLLPPQSCVQDFAFMCVLCRACICVCLLTVSVDSELLVGVLHRVHLHGTSAFTRGLARKLLGLPLPDNRSTCLGSPSPRAFTRDLICHRPDLIHKHSPHIVMTSCPAHKCVATRLREPHTLHVCAVRAVGLTMSGSCLVLCLIGGLPRTWTCYGVWCSDRPWCLRFGRNI